MSFSYVINKNIGRLLHSKILCSFSFFIIYCKTAIFTHTHLYRFQSTLDLTGNDSATASYDFEDPINLAEDESEDNCEVPGELARLLLHEERAIQPHEEPVEGKSEIGRASCRERV